MRIWLFILVIFGRPDTSNHINYMNISEKKMTKTNVKRYIWL
jgi:hypothetical protein